MIAVLTATTIFILASTGFIIYMIIDHYKFNKRLKKESKDWSNHIDKVMGDIRKKTMDRLKQIGDENAKLKAENERLKERLKDLGLYTDDKY